MKGSRIARHARGAVLALLLLWAGVLGEAAVLAQGQGGGGCPDGYRITGRQASGQSYDPNQANRTVLQITLQAADSNIPPRCNGAPVTISPQSGTAFAFSNGAYQLGFVQLNSNLVSQANVTRFVLAGNARNRLVRGEAVTIDLFELSAGQFPAAGEYRGTVLVQVGSGLPQAVLFAITVRPAIRFLAEQGAMSRDLSFGEVSAGSVIRTNVFYQSNAAVNITIQSQNRGRLVHTVQGPLRAIPYRLTYDGVPVNLSAGAQINRPFRGLLALREEMVLEVAPGTDRFAGDYRDVLTLLYTAY
jgi:spore coat protein U-like protein